MGGNTTNPCAHDFRIDMPFISLPLGAFVLFLNILSVVIIHRSPKLHTHANISVASIACGDIYLSLTYVIDGILKLHGVIDPLWNSDVLDAIIFGVGYSSLFLSVSQLGFIAVDRYIYIAHPLYYMAHVTRRRVYTTIACFWIVALVYGLIPIFVYRKMSNFDTCLLFNPPIEYGAVPCVLYHLEIILICVCYIRIARLAFQRKKASQARQVRMDSSTSERNTFSTKRAAAWRSVKFFATMCGIYFVCTYPLILALITNVFNSLPQLVFMPLMLLYLMHSPFNMFAYVSMNSDFRQGFRQLFVDMLHICLNTDNTHRI